MRARPLNRALFLLGLLCLSVIALLLRFAVVTDYLYARLVKDPERRAPPGRVIVAPADGTVLYAKTFADGVVPELIKKGVPVAIDDLVKGTPRRPLRSGVLVGIYMNTFGVHINRVPNDGVIRQRVVYNGPHISMTRAETRIVLTQLLPGVVELRKLLGLPPFGIEKEADYILKSAREAIWMEDERRARICVVRIADYDVGKILTWVREGEEVLRGQKMGMIAWGSQTDILMESSPGLNIRVRVGERVRGGETILATY